MCAETHPQQLVLEAEILSALDAMTEQERYTVLALVDGFFGGTEQDAEAADEVKLVFEHFPDVSGL